MSGLRNVWGSTDRRCGTSYTFGMGKSRCGGAAVVLGRHDGCFFPSGIGNDLLDILVATLRRLPVGIAERLRNLVNVKLVKESLVRALVGLRGERSHRGASEGALGSSSRNVGSVEWAIYRSNVVTNEAVFGRVNGGYEEGTMEIDAMSQATRSSVHQHSAL